MMAKACLLLVIASTTSARHLFEANRYLVQPLNPESDGNHNDQIVQRRNIDYNSGTSTNAHVIPDKFTPYENQGSQHHEPDEVKLDYSNQDSINSASRSHKTAEDGNDVTYTNVKVKLHYPTQDDTRSSVSSNDFYSETATRKMNTILPNYEGSLKTNVNQNAHRLNGNNGADISKTEAKTNRPTKMDADEEGLSSRTQNEDEKEEEVPWVWGSDPKEAQADAEGMDLTDRTAFVGDKCAKGYVKINGTCVEEH